MTKISIGQIIWGIVQFIGYIVLALGLAYKFGKEVTTIKAAISNTTRRLDEHIVRVERMFDRLWDDRFKK